MNNTYVLTLFLMLLSCAHSFQSNKQSARITQGIRGIIEIKEGNFMPGLNRVNQPVPAFKNSNAAREIFIYEPTRISQVTTLPNGFFTAIQTKLVTKVKSNNKGAFVVALKTGKYSVFTKEPQGLFANQFDGEGYIFLVEVIPRQITPVTFLIDYNATY